MCSRLNTYVTVWGEMVTTLEHTLHYSLQLLR